MVVAVVRYATRTPGCGTRRGTGGRGSWRVAGLGLGCSSGLLMRMMMNNYCLYYIGSYFAVHTDLTRNSVADPPCYFAAQTQQRTGCLP